MLDLKQQYQDLGESIKDAILKVSQEGNYILGPNVQRLESRLATYHRTKYGLGVASKIYYPLPLHLSPAYKYLGYKDGSLVHSEKASTESLALPIYPELKQEQVEDISKAILAAEKPI